MSQHPLRLLLDFDDRIQQDKEQDPAFLHRRDRRFALDCQRQGIRPGPATWLAHMARLSGPGGGLPASYRLQHRYQRIQHGFMAAGALLGAVTMAGLLFYDGGERINITLLLAFVLLQLLMAFATTFQALAGWQPWRWLQRRLQRQPPGPALAQLQPLLMARAAHTGAVAFAVTGLLTLLVMLAIQDLAFGWSTTLDTAAQAYHSLIKTIASPWAWLWPAAVPSPELVEATRFFRAAPQAGTTSPGEWGRWWPFVVMLWLTWVLIPRLLLLAFSHWAIRPVARHTLQQHPGLQALAWRMETPTVDTGNQHNDAGDLPDTSTRTRPVELADSRFIICWAGAGEPELPEQLLGRDNRIFKAGGRASLAEDDQVLATLANILAREPSPGATIVTRSWEPPTGELQDFLDQARERWPTTTRVLVLPLAANANQAPAEHQIQPWLRFTEKLPQGFARVALLPSWANDLYPIATELS